jgi:large subunit ribosomal protein L4
MINAALFSAAGEKRAQGVALPADYFDGTVNEPVMHQAVKAWLNNQRQGTHATKTRSFVSGGNQKPWKQKGTGRARQGSTRAPHWRGGGTVFGPHPRDYTTTVPKKVKQLARKSALNARAREGALHVIEALAFEGPKTKQLAELLEKLGVTGQRVLFLTAAHNEAVYLSARNIPGVEVLRYTDASAYDVLLAAHVIVEQAALGETTPAAADEAEAAPKKRTRAKKAEA